MKASSRTPDGESNHCPVCGRDVRIAPSVPAGEAHCPHCGVLLWFAPGEARFRLFHPLPGQTEVGAKSDIGDFQPGGPTDLSDGDQVRVRVGTFESFEGRVDALDQESRTVTVIVEIFGRPTPVEVEKWQLERL